jgi:hypothetical protein
VYGQARWALSVALAAGLLASGCAAAMAEPESKDEAASATDKGLDEEVSLPRAATEAPGEGTDSADDARAPQTRTVDTDYDWDGGAVETTTGSGVTFTVPEAWLLQAGTDTAAGEEAVHLWQDGSVRYAECVVFNTGVDAAPEGEVLAYLDFLGELEGGEHLEVDARPEPVEVSGADDAVRSDYSYGVPGAEQDAHGIIVAFTAATGEVVLFIVSGDGVEADEALSEEIVSTLSIGTPSQGEV